MDDQTAAIAELLNNYCHGLDDGDVDSWPSYFEQGGLYQITTRENVAAGYPIGIVLCEGRGMMEDRINALKVANIFEAHTYCHLTGQPAVKKGHDGKFSVRSNFAVFRTMYTGETELFANGKYLDEVVFDHDKPLFRERRVVLDSRRVDTLLVYPL